MIYDNILDNYKDAFPDVHILYTANSNERKRNTSLVHWNAHDSLY